MDNFFKTFTNKIFYMERYLEERFQKNIKVKEKWGENEINKWIQESSSDALLGEFNEAASKSIFKSYKTLCENEHSVLSRDIAVNMLDRLCKHLPLTQIEDTDDIWIKNITCNVKGENLKIAYQCKRMPALFKEVYSDGRIKYRDINRYCERTMNKEHNINYFCKDVMDLVMDELYPVTLPYYPNRNPYYIYTKLVYKNPDIVVIRYIVTPAKELVEVNRYFKKEMNEEYYIEITEEEYNKYKNTNKGINDEYF